MLEYFSFHNQYLRHPNILVRTLYLIIYLIVLLICGAVFVAIAFFFIIQHGRYNIETIQLESPYKIESKAAIIMVLNKAKAEYLDEWLPPLANYAKKWENKLYLDVERKLPKDDLLLDYLRYLIDNFSEDYTCKDCNHTTDRIKSFLDKIKYKRSIIRGVNLYWKPDYTNKMIFKLLSPTHDVYNKNQANLEELRSYLRDVLYDSKDKDDPLYNFKQLLFVEADCAILKKMLLNKYPEQSKKWCKAKEYQNWYEYVDEIYKPVIELKNDPEVMGTYVAKDSIEYIEKQKEYLDNFDKEFCKIK